MTIYYSTNPVEWGLLDGTYVNEVTPQATVTGAGTGKVGLVVGTDWGPQNELISISYIADVRKYFGFFSDLESQMINLTFSQLLCVRPASTADTSQATATLSAGLVLVAKPVGALGNLLQFMIEAATDANADHCNITLKNQLDGVEEFYENVDITTSEGRTAFTDAISGSSFVTVPTITATTRPANVAFTNFSEGETPDNKAAKAVIDGFVIFAKYAGSQGNFVRFSIENASDGVANHFKLNVQLVVSVPYGVTTLTQSSIIESYDNVDFTTSDGRSAFLIAVDNSNFISVPTLTATTRPVNTAPTNLFGGTTGTLTKANYTTALNQFLANTPKIISSEKSVNAGDVSDVVSSAIYDFVIINKSIIGVLGFPDNVPTAITNAANFRENRGSFIGVTGDVLKQDGYGRLIAMNTPLIMTSTLSMNSPSLDPSYVTNNVFFAGVTKLISKNPRSRSDYIDLKAAGLCAPEHDDTYGFKYKMGVTTQILNKDLRQIYTRRMTNYLVDSVATYLVNFQNAPNTKQNRQSAKGAIISFIKTQQLLGLLPSGDSSYKIDVETPNTPEILANNMFIIDWKQQLFGSMASIVLSLEAGASVQLLN